MLKSLFFAMYDETKVVVALVCVLFIVVNVVLVNKHLPLLESFNQHQRYYHPFEATNEEQYNTNIFDCSPIFCTLRISNCWTETMDVVKNLAMYLQLPPSEFTLERESMEGGVPLFICPYDQTCCDRFNLYGQYITCNEGKINILATLSFELDIFNLSTNMHKKDFTVHWKASKDTSCITTKSKHLLDLIISYETILKDSSLSNTLGCSALSWALFQLTPKHNEREIPIHKFFTSRKKRSVPHTPGVILEESLPEIIPPRPTMTVQHSMTLPTTLHRTASSKTVMTSYAPTTSTPLRTAGRGISGTLLPYSTKTLTQFDKATEGGSGSHSLASGSGSGSFADSSQLTISTTLNHTSPWTSFHPIRWQTSVPLWDLLEHSNTSISPSLTTKQVTMNEFTPVTSNTSAFPNQTLSPTITQTNYTTKYEVVTKLAVPLATKSSHLLTTIGYANISKLPVSRLWRAPKMLNITAEVGKVFQFTVPLEWTQSASAGKDVHVNTSMPVDTINKTSTTWLGLLLEESLFDRPIHLTVETNSRGKWPSQLLLQVARQSTAVPQYLVTVNCSVSQVSNENTVVAGKHFATLNYIVLNFIHKLTDYLPHVDVNDVTITNWNQTLHEYNNIATKSKHFNIFWFIDKFSYQTFHSHYLPLLAIPEEDRCTEQFFFAMLPEFVIGEVGLTEFSVNHHDNNNFGTATNSLTVVLPICLIGIFMLVSSIVLVLMHNRKRLQNSSILMGDHAFSRPRKPVCLENEIEMDNFQPSKPRILMEERRALDTVVDENEITFSSSSLSNSSVMNVSDTDLPLGGTRKVSGYSFLNARFQTSNIDESSTSSGTSSSSFVFREIFVTRKGK